MENYRHLIFLDGPTTILSMVLSLVRLAWFVSLLPFTFSREGATDLASLTALNYAEEGDIAFGSGDRKNSLAFYRAAVRLNRFNGALLVKLGTAEYAMNLLDKSKRRFQRVLELEDESDNAATATYYLKQIEEKQKKIAMFLDESDDIDENDKVDLPLPEFASDIWEIREGKYHIRSFDELSQHPFIIRQSLPHMQWNMEYFQLDNLKSEAGSVVVDFYPQNMLSRPEKTFNVPLSEAIDFLRFPEGAYLTVDISEPGTYIQCNLNSSLWKNILIKANVNLSPYFISNLETFFTELAISGSGDIDVEKEATIDQISAYFAVTTHWNMLLIGEQGSGMFDHQDALPVGSWQAQVSGSKHFRLCAPVDKTVSAAATVSVDSSITAPEVGDVSGFEDDDEEEEDEEELKGPCMEGTSSAGDFLYYPPHWHHQTLNTEGPSVALSGTLILAGQHKREFRDLLVRECGPLKEKNYQFTTEFCQFILQSRD